MMKQVPIASADNSGAETLDGRTIGVIGGGRVAAGDVAWAMGDFAFSPGRPGGRAPIVWAPDAGYNFADSNKLKIYHTNTAISKPVRAVVPIKPPVTGAALILHCYDKSSRYFVWFSGSRCVITKNTSKIADFTSVFGGIPSESDAYIDSSGNLIWGAAGQSGDIVTMARYKNGELTFQKSYSEETVEAAFAARIEPRLRAVEFTAVAIPGDTVSYSYVFWDDAPLSGIAYRASYTGCEVRNTPESVIASAVAGTPLFDLLSVDALIPVFASGSVYIQVHVSATSYDGDASYYGAGASALLHNVTIHRNSSGEIIAELQAQQEPFVGTVDNVEYDVTITDVAGEYDEYRQQYPITRTVNQTLCSVEITASLPSINTDTQTAISTDIGNGYTVKNRLKIEDVNGWVSPVGWIEWLEREGDPPKKIYDAPQYNKLAGAWRSTRPNTAEALGVAGGKVLKIREDSVTESAPPIDFSSVVTKRFT